MQVGEPLDGIGEGLLVDLGVLGADAVADGAVGGGGESLAGPSVYSMTLVWMVISSVRAANDGTAIITDGICVQSRFHGFLLHQKCPLLLGFRRWH